MDVPLEVLIKQAVDLKTSQLAEDRRHYDSHPLWYRNSLFARGDVLEIRKTADFASKWKFVNQCREKGNYYFRSEDYLSAIIEYERGLSIWDWIESLLEDWKHNAIQDKDLLEKSYHPANAEEARKIRQSKVSNLLNLSLCYLKNQQFLDCVAACDEVLTRLEPHNLKAFYRRAQARVLPKNCGISEHLLALRDLKRAISIYQNNSRHSNSSSNEETAAVVVMGGEQEDKDKDGEEKKYREILRLYRQVQRDVFLMKQFEKRHFLHLFERIKEQPETPRSGEERAETDRSVEEEVFHPLLDCSVSELRGLVREVEEKIELSSLRQEKYEEEEEKELREKLQVLRQLLLYREQQQQQQKRDRDFPPPSEEETIKDLRDSRQRELPAAAALDLLYEKEAKTLAEIAMRDCAFSSLQQMMLSRTRQTRQTHEAVQEEVLWEDGEVRRWSEELLRERLEASLVRDFLATYRQFRRSSEEVSEQQEREEWSQAVLETLRLYHSPKTPSSSLSRWAMLLLALLALLTLTVLLQVLFSDLLS